MKLKYTIKENVNIKDLIEELKLVENVHFDDRFNGHEIILDVESYKDVKAMILIERNKFEERLEEV